MQGRKAFEERLFTNFQLSDRVPADNFYRRLKETLDLRFIYKATAKYYGTEGKSIEAIDAFRTAVSEEDKLVYREPQDWLILARQFMGAYLLRMNKALEAEKVYTEDLVINPGNGWSLVGMHQSLEVQKKRKEAAAYKIKYTKAFEASDVQAVASIFF